MIRLPKSRLAAAALCTLLFGIVIGCGLFNREPHPRQRTPLSSPDGEFVAFMEIRAARGREFRSYWHVRFESSGAHAGEDEEGLPAAFQVYWDWDRRGRFWIYNSDDGRYRCFAPVDESMHRLEDSDCTASEAPASVQRDAIYGN